MRVHFRTLLCWLLTRLCYVSVDLKLINDFVIIVNINNLNKVLKTKSPPVGTEEQHFVLKSVDTVEHCSVWKLEFVEAGRVSDENPLV